MPILPFLAMTPKYKYDDPKNTLPLPELEDGTQSTNAYDSNLVNQLENARYGQSNVQAPLAPFIQRVMEEQQMINQVAKPPVANVQSNYSPEYQNQQQANTPEELNKQNEYMLAFQQAQDLQNQAIKSAEEQLAAARSQPQQLDLSPLIALSESWSGKPSRLLQTYQRPQDQAKSVQALQDAVLKARGGAADIALRRADTSERLKEAKEARVQRLEEISLRKGELKQAKEDRAEDRKLRLELEQNDKYYKQFGEGISGLTEVISAARDAQNLIEESGGDIPTDIAKFDQYKRAISRIITGYNRDVAKLGALAGADKKLLEAAASNDPNLLEAYLKNAIGLNKGQRGVLDDLIAAGDKKMKEHEQLVKIRFKGMADPFFSAQKAIYSQERETEPAQKNYTKEELIQIRQQDPERFKKILSEATVK